MTIKIAINGAGRIGRSLFRLALEREELTVVAINDLADLDQVAYLINHDSVYGSFKTPVRADSDKGELQTEKGPVKFLQTKDPKELPWGELGVEVVAEATGVFNTFDQAEQHLTAGAKRVVLTAPAKDEPAGEHHKNILLGVNEEELKSCLISSNGSCTTNAGSPVIQILHGAIGINKAMLSTTHAYTASQALVDSYNPKSVQLGRAAALNIIPTTTGAATATTKAITDLAGKFDGIALRVPVPAGSVADLTMVTARETSVEEVNDLLRQAAETAGWQKVFAVSEEPLVSSDVVGRLYGSIADLSFTKVVDGDLVKVLAWYDNEAGYNQTLLEHIIKAGRYINSQ